MNSEGVKPGIPVRSEEDLLDNLEQWLAARDQPPNLFEMIQGGDRELVAAYLLKVFRRATRKAVLRRLDLEAAFFGPDSDQLGNAVARVFGGLSQAWKLSPQEQAALLGCGSPEAVPKAILVSDSAGPIEVIERVAILLDIFRDINALLPFTELADAWIRKPNSAPLFDGQTALSFMMRGLEQIRQVRQYLLAERS